MRRSLLRVFAAGLLSVVAHAQATLLVGPVGSAPYQQIQDALNVAQSGDRIQVLPGVYETFVASVPVTIVGTPGTVMVTATAVAGDHTVLSPVGGSLHLVGIDFVNQPVIPIIFWRNLEVSGRVTMDRCTVDLFIGMVSVADADFHLQSCSLAALAMPQLLGGSTILAERSRITMVGTSVGMHPSWIGNQLGVVHLSDSHLYASGSTIDGMDDGTNTVTPALTLDDAASATISDSVLTARYCVIRAALMSPNPAGPVTLARTSLQSGCLACATGCAAATTAPLIGVERTGALQPGSSFAMTLTSQPNTPVFVLAAPQLATIEVPQLLAQPSWLDFGSYFLAAIAATDSQGVANYGFMGPNVGSLLGETLWLEGIGYGSLPLQVSPPVGGVVTN